MILNFIHWNIDPEIFSIGPLSVRWYGLLFAGAFFTGYYIMLYIFKREKIGQDVLDKLTMYMFLSTVIGARLGHCFFYEPMYYLHNPLEIFKIWHGGLASHGAAVAILIGLYIFARNQGKPYLWVLDRVVITVALSGVFIRTGNLMNSEIFGHPTDVPWAFIFDRENPIPRHPTQVYEALSYLLIFGFLIYSFFKVKKAQNNGFIFGWFLVLLFSARFFIEYFKEYQVRFEEGMALNMGQILSIPFILTGILVLVYSNKTKEA